MTVTILTIDDNEDDQRLYRRALRDIDGYVLESALSAETGLAGAVELKPDLILLDYNLPDMDGLSFMTKLAEYPELDIPIIMLTGQGNETVAVEAIKGGAVDYIVKDTLGGFLKLLPSVIRRVLVCYAQKAETRRLKALHRIILHTVADGIIGIDDSDTILFANNAAEQLLSYPVGSLTGRPIMQLFGFSRDASGWSTHPLAVMPKDAAVSRQMDAFIYRENGESFPVSCTVSRLEVDGDGAVGWVLAFQDITERKQLEQELRTSEKYQRAIFEATPDGLLISDEEGVIVMLNRQSASMLGYAENELLGQSIEILVPERFRARHPALRAQFSASPAARLMGACREIQARRKDGSIFDVDISLSSIQTDQGLFFASALRDVTQRKQEKLELQKFKAIIASTDDAIFTKTLDGNIDSWNHGAEKIFGFTGQEVIGKPMSMLLPFDHLEEEGKILSRIARGERVDRFESVYRCKDGRLINASVTISPILDLNDRVVAASVIVRDITENKRAEANLRIAATVFESQEGILITDATSKVLRVNQAFTRTTGYSAEDIVGRKPSILKSGRHDAAFYTEMWEQINRTGTWQGEIWDRRKSGEIYPKWLIITAVRGDDGAVTHYVGTHIDITLRKSAEDEIKHLAFYDPLTQLPNRRLLLDRLRQALTIGARRRQQGAVLFLDLDKFKILNDTLGHDMGDLLLQQVAGRLLTCVRESDTVARFGGDEFVVMLGELSNNADEAAAQVGRVAEKILTSLNLPFQLAGHSYRSTPSIGIALFTDHEISADELMKRADIAMYQAKTMGRNAIRFFDPVMQEAVTTRATLEADLHKGIQQSQFVIYYQPQVDSDGRLMGAEALVRWQHPERGLVSPAEFIPLAEETGLILPLGHWILDNACAQLAAWAVRADSAHLTLAVNVSPRQFFQPDFVEQVLEALDHSGADPAKLKLELTEGMLLKDVEDIIAKMVKLKAKGVKFSLDDFGTGYSSLSYLKRLPLDQLKIDQAFVRDLLSDVNDTAITTAIITMAQSLSLDVIAEGVETEEQRHFLAQNGCNTYQGYLFMRPGTLKEFERFLNG